jgi:hypothetical protein
MNRTGMFVILGIVLAVFVLSGCSATRTAIEHRNLDVQVKMSETIFLDIAGNFEKTIFVDVRNTSQHEFQINDLLRQALVSKGYEIKENPRDSYYILQANVLYIGKDDPQMLLKALYNGYGTPLDGLIAGGAIGYLANQRVSGVGVGGLLGAGTELVADSLVKNVTYSMMVDLQISERSDVAVEQTMESDLTQGTSTQIKQTAKSKNDLMRYRTRILSSANKVNLDFEEAQPVLEAVVSRAISGIF